MNAQKILVAGIGLAVLAGLALHQGGVQQPAPEERSILVGTALDAAAQDAAREAARDRSVEAETEPATDPCNPESADPAGNLADCAAEATAENPTPDDSSQPG